MSQLLLIQFSLSLFAAFLGAAAGWWLRGHRGAVVRKVDFSTTSDRRDFAKQALQSLHAAAETVRCCVEQHIECMRAVQKQLKESPSTEPAIITNAAASIIAANGLVQHQFEDIQRLVSSKKEEISDCLTSSKGLMVTFAAFDRQKHVYRQVLSSLETLAAELIRDVEGHGRRLQHATNGIQDESQQNLTNVNGAVTKILDATEDIQRRVATTEMRIAEQAENVQMQAILSHTDLLTSLPNRRAFDAELQRVASSAKSRAPLCTVLFVDLDKFAQVNTEYGHEGGDVILRQAGATIKSLLRGKDLVARYGGDTFAVLLSNTTLHDALPMAEKIRKQLEKKQFSHGSRPLQITASVGVAQLNQDEMMDSDLARPAEALQAAISGGGNICYRHDGQACFPVSSAFAALDESAPESTSLASLWRDSSIPGVENPAEELADSKASAKRDGDAALSGRSLFAANLNRRLSEWKRGGHAISVGVVQIDQMEELVGRFGAQGEAFIRQVMARLLEAATRDMDERCEFEDGLFALMLPGTDEANALAVADRLRSQVRQCKVRMGNDLWDLTASIGLAHCTVASRVMDIMQSAETAMRQVAKHGGDGIRIANSVATEAEKPA